MTMGKKYKKRDLIPGSTIEQVVELLLHYRYNGFLVSVDFNGQTLYSDTVTMEDAYLQILGMTKTEYENHIKGVSK